LKEIVIFCSVPTRVDQRTFDHRSGGPYNEYAYDDIDVEVATFANDALGRRIPGHIFHRSHLCQKHRK
jgi:hypothetical protein